MRRPKAQPAPLSVLPLGRSIRGLWIGFAQALALLALELWHLLVQPFDVGGLETQPLGRLIDVIFAVWQTVLFAAQVIGLIGYYSSRGAARR